MENCTIVTKCPGICYRKNYPRRREDKCFYKQELEKELINTKEVNSIQ